MRRRRRATRARERGSSPRRGAEIEHSKLRLLGVGLVCAKVALVPLVFDNGADVPFTVPKALLGHGLSFVLTGILIGLLIRFGTRFVLWSWLHLPVVAFLAVNLVAAVLAADPGLALYGAHVRMLGLGTIADWVALYFAIVLLVRTKTEAVAVIVSAVGASVFVLAYEAVQLAGKDPFQWTIDPASRPFSMIGQPTSLAMYLTIVALGVLTLGVFADRLDGRVRGLAVALVVALLAGAAATGTRSTVLGIGAGSALLVLLIWALHPSPRARIVSLAVGIAATVALAALLVLTPLGSRLATTLESATASGADDDLLARLEPSAAGRVALYAVAFDMVGERPLLGYGPDNFAVGVSKYRTDSEPPEIQQSLATSGHSWIAYIATGSGVIGLACFLAIVGAALFLSVSGGFRPIAIAGAVMLGAFLGTGLTTVSDIGTDWLFWTSIAAIAASTPSPPPAWISGLVTGNVERERGSTRQLTKREPAIRRLAAAPCLVIALALAVAGVNAFDATRVIRESRDARLLGKIPQAIERGVHATTADPGRADYWHHLGLAYVGAGRWADASAAFDRASKLAPYDVRHLGDLARAQLILAAKGDANARFVAMSSADKAVQIDPNNPLAQLTRAVVMQSTGNLSEALHSVDRALVLDPQSINDALYVTAAQIKLASDRPGEAIAVARHGLAVFGATKRTIPLRIELARALVANGQRVEALNELDAALSIQPNDSSVEQLRAQIRAGLEQ